MDRTELLQRADMLHSMAMEMNAHELDNAASQLGSQYNAYGHLMAAMQDVLTELYGAEFAAEVRNESIEHGEAPSAVVKYRRNCDHAEAIETAEVELDAQRKHFTYWLDSDPGTAHLASWNEIKKLEADGIAASYYRRAGE